MWVDETGLDKPWSLNCLKQTFKFGNFLGHSANAIRWQVWTALLVKAWVFSSNGEMKLHGV